VDKDTVLIGQGFGSSRVPRSMGAESGNQFRGILSMLDSQPSTPVPGDSRVVYSTEPPSKPSPVIDPKKRRSTVRASHFKPKQQAPKMARGNRINSIAKTDSKTLEETSPWGLEQNLREFFRCPKKIEYFEDFNYQEIEALFTKMKLEKERLLSKYNQVGRFLKCAQDFVELKTFAMKMDNVLTPSVINEQNTLIDMYEHLSGLLSKNDKF
jgi:hypothetical protein